MYLIYEGSHSANDMRYEKTMNVLEKIINHKEEDMKGPENHEPRTGP